MECFKVSVMKSYLNHFFSLHRFPDEASRTLTNMFDIIMGSENRDRKNDMVIVTHIPSGSPLYHSSCIESYARAEKYYRKKYRKEFANKPMPFVGYSWMLYPPIKDILVENSNIIQFVNDYDIYHCDSQNMDEDLWRVFGKEYKKPPEELPQNTRLQKNIVNWLLEGNHLYKAGTVLSLELFIRMTNRGSTRGNISLTFFIGLL
ncbi:MAG: hypothetical protein PHX08_04925 [Lachnospiraceae bacterium]|nr:hypothetical protein [Lachnospiraceae bacterium]